MLNNGNFAVQHYHQAVTYPLQIVLAISMQQHPFCSQSFTISWCFTKQDIIQSQKPTQNTDKALTQQRESSHSTLTLSPKSSREICRLRFRAFFQATHY